MSTYLTHGVILNKDNHKDYDAKFVIYTLGHGKISAILRGAKKITSKLNSHLEFFSVVKIMVAKGASFNRLAGAQLEVKYKNINSSTSKTIIALYFLEVVNLLIKYDFEDDVVFEIITRFLSLLDDGKSKQDDLLCLNKNIFELLDHLGYKPEIKSNKQKGLIAEFNKIVTEIADRQVKSYVMLSKLFD
ncbi:MAG: DNA repair protein RecO [Candidatus Buchananbacteria bacterium]|nr:DNA repair protein RecO [Candidatus Buchananbacteria bacterium]